MRPKASLKRWHDKTKYHVIHVISVPAVKMHFVLKTGLSAIKTVTKRFILHSPWMFLVEDNLLHSCLVCFHSKRSMLMSQWCTHSDFLFGRPSGVKWLCWVSAEPCRVTIGPQHLCGLTVDRVWADQNMSMGLPLTHPYKSVAAT